MVGFILQVNGTIKIQLPAFPHQIFACYAKRFRNQEKKKTFFILFTQKNNIHVYTLYVHMYVHKYVIFFGFFLQINGIFAISAWQRTRYKNKQWILE